MSTRNISTRAGSTISAALDHLPERDRHLFVARTLRVLSTVPTMQDLANAWGVTRQRVDQLQRRAEGSIRQELDNDSFVRSMATELRAELGIAYPLKTLNDVVILAEMSAGEGPPASERKVTLWHTAVWFAGFELTRDGWALAHPGVKPTPLVNSLAERARARGGVTFDDAVSMLAESGFKQQAADALLESGLPDMRRFGDEFLPWGPTLLEKAETVLRRLQQPATVEEIIESIGESASPRSMVQRMLEDPRFVRTGKSTIGLRAWGLEDYSGISNEITERIAEAGGQILLKEVVPAIASRFGVAESSVRAYAHAPCFVVEDGLVRLRTDEAIPLTCGELPLQARRLENGSLRYVLGVTEETLRGSGHPLSAALAAALGVKPGDERLYSAGSGLVVRIGWKMTSPQPHMGSLSAGGNVGADMGHDITLEFDPTMEP